MATNIKKVMLLSMADICMVTSIFEVLIVSILLPFYQASGAPKALALGLFIVPCQGLALGLPRIALSGGLGCLLGSLKFRAAWYRSGVLRFEISHALQVRTFSGLPGRNGEVVSSPNLCQTRGSVWFLSVGLTKKLICLSIFVV
ncbi:MAG: hypothetical protein WC001_01050 [Desulfurivibrionaceae bacterium]